MITKKNYTKLTALLDFDHLIAPYLIKMIYWLGIPVIVVAGVLSCINNGGSYGSVVHALIALGGTLLVLLIWRLVSELWILAFNIYERLVEIRDLMARQTQTPAAIQPALRDDD
ncbi:uncharacterized protein DUF4282 [Collimonas sp. PA-H2]|uniref:DUF4282 domain-containing protein n=1 Tax=Collimonas sp. PA-H2 TaxID=1881062 RepID=UPI000BF8DD21|nr:DUF4282 domain-containing protein [Collimonas sp. PA-H2]PFH10767.1 uncharacterized protein DUF4282 [Collimonas sp. PA-H2]